MSDNSFSDSPTLWLKTLLMLLTFLMGAAVHAQTQNTAGKLEKAAILDLICSRIKANSDRLKTWRATYSFSDVDYMSEQSARQYAAGTTLKNAATVPPLVTKTRGQFMIEFDQSAQAFYSSCVPEGPPAVSIVSTGERLINPAFDHTTRMAIHVSGELLHCMPNERFGQLRGGSKIPGLPKEGTRLIYREAAENSPSESFCGDIIDPRSLFGITHRGVSVLPMYSKSLRSSEEVSTSINELLKVSEVSDDGRRRYVVTLSSRRGAVDELELDDQSECNPGIWQQLQRNGQPSVRQEWKYSRHSGVVVPTFIKYTVYRRNGHGTQFERTFNLVSNAVNEPIAPETFTVARFGAENGDRVLDQQTGKVFVYSDGDLIPSQDYAPKTVVSKRTSALSYARGIGICASAALVVVLSIVWLRRR